MARIINLSKQTLLAERAQLAADPWARMKGLLGRRDLPAGDGLVLRPCSAVHTFFMRFPVDLLFLDKDNRVVKAVAGLEPNRFSAASRARCCIELPAGVIRASLTAEGHVIRFSS